MAIWLPKRKKKNSAMTYTANAAASARTARAKYITTMPAANANAVGADHQFQTGSGWDDVRAARSRKGGGDGRSSTARARAGLRGRRWLMGGLPFSENVRRAPGAHVPESSTTVLRIRIGDDRAAIACRASLAREMEPASAHAAREQVLPVSPLAANLASCRRVHDSHFR